MKLSECKWLRTVVASDLYRTKISPAPSNFTGPKWCTVKYEDGVMFQINYASERGDYQVNVHWYATSGMARHEEYTSTFWIGSTLELVAFLQDKQPM